MRTEYNHAHPRISRLLTVTLEDLRQDRADMASTLDSQTVSGLLNDRSDTSMRGIGVAKAGSVGTLSRAQNRAILIVAVTTASISLAIAVVSLRWFLSMKRSFRHHLILMLIISDSFKALGYFISPVVIFSCGQIESSPAFSQASGFLLATGIEAADLFIFFIALQTTLYIFHPPQRLGNGGLYSYRHWVYGLWLFLPLPAASLAFTNHPGPAYVTSGTFSYLPKRPFWYRLALAWIPRYIVFVSIIAMYTAIYIYVKVKFKGFDSLGSDDFSFDPSSAQASIFDQRSPDASFPSPHAKLTGEMAKHERSGRKPSTSSTCTSPLVHTNGRKRSQIPEDIPEWEKIDFITTSPLVSPQRISQLSLGITAADFAADVAITPTEVGCELSQFRRESQRPSQATRSDSTALTLNTNSTSDTAVAADRRASSPTKMRSSPTLKRSGAADHLTIARSAIRRQLRFLFMYPLIYLLLWILPFVQHCLNYTDYYTAHPQFWLNICTTCILSLQVGVDCAIFAWRERPWMRMEGHPLMSVWAFRKLRAWFSTEDEASQIDERKNDIDRLDPEAGKLKSKKLKRDSNWWEEEGKIASAWARILSTTSFGRRRGRVQRRHGRRSDPGVNLFPALHWKVG